MDLNKLLGTTNIGTIKRFSTYRKALKWAKANGYHVDDMTIMDSRLDVMPSKDSMSWIVSVR